MGERLVIVIEYDADPDTELALNDAMAQIREGADRLDPDRVEMQQIHVATKDYAERVLAVFDKDAISAAITPKVDFASVDDDDYLHALD